MSALRFVQLEPRADGVRILTMDKPPVNALGRELVEELGRAVALIADDASARVVVVRSGGKHFSAGADLKERRGMSLDEVRAFVPALAGVCSAIAELASQTACAVKLPARTRTIVPASARKSRGT